MIEYQRALAQALTQGHGSVPGVSDQAVAQFARLAQHKRRALRGQTCTRARPRWLAALRSAGRWLCSPLGRGAAS